MLYMLMKLAKNCSWLKNVASFLDEKNQSEQSNR